MENITLEEKFNQLFQDNKDVFFVQIGANDGITFDPIYNFILKNGWKGILFEPGDDAYNQLINNYKEVQNLIFEKSAVSNYDGKGNLFCGSTILHFTLVESVANRYFSVQPKPVEVEILSPTTVINKYNIKKLDLLQIDTEGHDMTIIRAFPFNIIKPKAIRFEFIHLAFDNESDSKAEEFLINLGYKIYKNSNDILAVLE